MDVSGDVDEFYDADSQRAVKVSSDVCCSAAIWAVTSVANRQFRNCTESSM
jgi:hypothetical protein